MATAAPMEADERQSVREMASTFSLTGLLLLASLTVFILPTMQFVAREGWTGEEGAHGPIILFTGLWLLWREWAPARRFASPPSITLVAILLVALVPLYIFARVTQIVEIEAYLMYAVMLVVLYSIIGAAAMKRLWFPLLYLGFAFPPPDTLVAAVTVPLKIELSRVSIAFLDMFGYPIGGEGVRIFIGQYELLVAAACSGLNSIISLTAISLFYVYLRHQAEWRYALLLVVLVIPIALLANFARVLILILLTYHAGEATAQGFLHNFAGIFMFAIALGLTFLLDELIRPIWKRRVQKVD